MNLTGMLKPGVLMIESADNGYILQGNGVLAVYGNVEALLAGVRTTLSITTPSRPDNSALTASLLQELDTDVSN